MKHFIDDDFVLSPPPEGPLASYVIPFAQWLVDRGYGLFFKEEPGADGCRLQQTAPAKWG
jgi:hypothetical protein